jgi:uncharacterized protein
MITHIFTVYDSKTEAYLPPFYAQSKGAALRSFMDAVGDPQHEFAKHAEDYTLFYLGTFDDQSAQFVPQKTPQSLGVAIELKNSKAA